MQGIAISNALIIYQSIWKRSISLSKTFKTAKTQISKNKTKIKIQKHKIFRDIATLMHLYILLKYFKGIEGGTIYEIRMITAFTLIIQSCWSR